MRKPIPVLLLTLIATASAALTADHEAADAFTLIPETAFAEIRAGHDFFYGHTSHGSQIMTGLDILAGQDPVLYARPSFHEISDDLGHNGDTSWVAPTESYLDTHPDCNVVMWSWCGGCSDNTEAGIAAYLEAMEGLEAAYGEVLFVYMTGHLDGTGTDGNLYARNDQIREYCELNDKILFDFADIESWDPDGNYYPDETDACNWCYDWCAVEACPGCDGCAHSHCFNCYQKGKAFWWMMARLDGWSPTAADEAPAAQGPRLTAWPNPFNPVTRLRAELPEGGRLSLVVHELSGRRVRVLHEGYCQPGSRHFAWDGRDGAGRVQESGVYLCRMICGDFEETLKLTLLK